MIYFSRKYFKISDLVPYSLLRKTLYATILGAFFGLFTPLMLGQCGTLYVGGSPTIERTDSNEVTGTSTIWPTAQPPGGSWTVVLKTEILFTAPGESEDTIASESKTFVWTPQTPVGEQSTETKTAIEELNPHGTGQYRTRRDITATCLGVPAT